MNETNIAWTDKTWNPVTGCRQASPGCRNCYAKRFAERWRGVTGNAYEHGFDFQLRPERLDQPARWTKPCMIFVCSMSDLFQSSVTNKYLDRVFDVIEGATHHTFQVLTKRSFRMQSYLALRWKKQPPAHIWVGVTAENQEQASIRVPNLQRTPASVRFISSEPLLEPVRYDLTDIHQVIVGGESGPDFRQMDPAWAVGIKDQCAAADVPFFFKQHSGVHPKDLGDELEGHTYKEYPLSSMRV